MYRIAHAFTPLLPLLAALLISSVLLIPTAVVASAPARTTQETSVCAAVAATPTSAPTSATPVALTSGATLALVEDVSMPGSASRFDYQSFDPATGRLYLAHMGADQLVVVDTATRTVIGTIDGLPMVTGVLAVPELHRVYAATAGNHRVAVIDDRSLRILARLGDIGFPDGLDYDPSTQRVFVSDESGGGELVLDGATDRVETTIELGGEAGNTHYDAGSGCILVAMQTRNELIAIDPAGLDVAGRYALDPDCEGPHGFLVDAPHRLAFVTCEDDAMLLVVDLMTMRVRDRHEVGRGPDVLAFDPGLGWLYVASEAGIVSIFAEAGMGLQRVGEYRAPHAHSVSVDPATHLVYLPLQDVGGSPVLRIMKPKT